MNENEYNAKIGMRIKEARKAQKITLKELGNSVGISESTTKRYEDGQIKGVNVNIIKKFAAALDVSPAWLMGYDDTPAATSHRHGVKIPVLGYVAAGQPIYASEHWIDEEEIPESMARTGDYFGLIIHGESMEPEIYDGDIVIVRKQETCKNRQIAIVLINGDDATCKIVHLQQDGILLEGRNYKVYTPTFYNNEAIEKLPVQIIGVVAEVRRKYPI